MSTVTPFSPPSPHPPSLCVPLYLPLPLSLSLPQRKRESSSVLWQMRRQLLLELVAILPRSRSTHVPNDSESDAESSSGYSGLREEHVVKASALLRLYCALMGIAGLR